MTFLETIFCSFLSAAGVGVISVVAIRTDMVWVKDKLTEHGKRIYNLESRRREYK